MVWYQVISSITEQVTSYLKLYFKDAKAPIQVLGYPRMTSRLHLEDHKLLLGTHHIEQGTHMQHFTPHSNEWVDIRWDSPLLVNTAGAAILLRVQGITDLEHWDIHVGIALGAGWCKKGKAKAKSSRAHRL